MLISLSLSARRAWIEMALVLNALTLALSLSARRAWIEILAASNSACAGAVALRKESVDRNSIALASFRACITVALRKESVDRNLFDAMQIIVVVMSLSARRAWIEMLMIHTAPPWYTCRSPQGERG